MTSDPVPSDAGRAAQEKGPVDPLGDQDLRYDLRFEVDAGSGGRVSESARGIIRMGLASTSRGRVVARLEDARQKLIEGVTVQLSQLQPTEPTQRSAVGQTELGFNDARVRFQVVIEAKNSQLAQENWADTLRGLLAPDQRAEIGLRIRNGSELTFRNAIIRLNSRMKEPEIRTTSRQPFQSYSWSTVRQLLDTEGQAPFPLEALPEPVRVFVESLACRCSVPASLPATACLALASGLAGHRFVVDRGYGAPAGVNLYFAVAVDPSCYFRVAVESVLRPAQRLQEELTRGEFEAGYPTRSRSFMEKWRRQQEGNPWVLVSSANPAGEWEKAPDRGSGGLFHYTWDDELLVEIMEQAEKGKRHPAAAWLKRGYTPEPSIGTFKDGRQKLIGPPASVGLMWLCTGQVLARFGRSRPLLEEGVLRHFILLDSEARPAQLTKGVLEPVQGEMEWERSLRDIVDWNLGTGDQIWEGRAAVEPLAIFANMALEQMKTTVAPEYWMVPEWADRAWRMSGLVQLLSGSWGAVIDPEAAWKGILLTAWYLGRQLRWYTGSRGKPKRAAAVSKEDVLDRLRKSPLSDAELLHGKFHRFTAAERDRIISELRQEGLIQKNDAGQWVPMNKATSGE